MIIQDLLIDIDLSFTGPLNNLFHLLDILFSFTQSQSIIIIEIIDHHIPMIRLVLAISNSTVLLIIYLVNLRP